MNLYYYCSYDGSPVGFRIGRIDALSRDEKIELSSEKIEPFIRRCFETGLVRSAFGKIPSDADSEKKFFLLKKKLRKKADYNYYMNVAVVEEEWDKFCSLLQDGVDEVSLATAVMSSIKPYGENAFGYRVDTQKLSKVLECGFASVCNCNETRINNVQKNDAFYATLSTETPDTDALKKSLGIVQGSSTHTEITKESGKVFCFGKKKECQHSECEIRSGLSEITGAGKNSFGSRSTINDYLGNRNDSNPHKAVSENKTESSLVSSLLKHVSLSLDKRFGKINKKSNSPNDDNE